MQNGSPSRSRRRFVCAGGCAALALPAGLLLGPGAAAQGLDRFATHVSLKDGIAVFDVDCQDVMVSRYAPYHFYPEARYSIGILRYKDGAKITAMRNPWKDFPSVPLGKLFEEHGGGGHRRVGSVLLRGEQLEHSQTVLDELLRQIATADREADQDEKP